MHRIVSKFYCFVGIVHCAGKHPQTESNSIHTETHTCAYHQLLMKLLRLKSFWFHDTKDDDDRWIRYMYISKISAEKLQTNLLFINSIKKNSTERQRIAQYLSILASNFDVLISLEWTSFFFQLTTDKERRALLALKKDGSTCYLKLTSNNRNRDIRNKKSGKRCTYIYFFFKVAKWSSFGSAKRWEMNFFFAL